MTEARKTVLLKVFGDQQYFEKAVITSAITPGEVVALSGADSVAPLGSVAGKNVPVVVAIENDLFGGLISTTYAVGDRARLTRLRAGDEFNALLGAGISVTVGDYLTVAGTGGALKKTTTTGDIQMFQAIETVDNSAGSSAVRLAVRVIDGIAY